MTATRVDFALNIYDPAVKNNPYPHYAEMLSAGRVLRNPFLGGQYMVHRYNDTQTVLRDDRRFSNAHPAQNAEILFKSATMLDSDPPEHTRLRGVLRRAFTPRSILKMEPRIRKLARRSAEPLASGDTFDLVSEFSTPLPTTVIAEMLGVSVTDRDDFARWSHDIIASLTLFADQQTLVAARESANHLREYFAEEIALRHRKPGDDLITRLLEANTDGILTHEELLSSCILLLLGGNETTTNLITNGALALARHPDQRAQLVRDPSLIATAVEEFLRFDTPVQGDLRTAIHDTEIAGQKIPKGAAVVALLAAANHDPTHFTHPEQFDVTRSPNPHLSLGTGAHFCLGAYLARLEVRVAFEELLKTAPDFQLAAPAANLEYGPNFFFHAPLRLELAACT